MEESERFDLNKRDGKKILKGFLIAIGGAALTFVAELIPGVNFGEWTPAVVALSACLVNLGRKLLERDGELW